MIHVPIKKIRVFVDTNIILESFRTGCWQDITQKFVIETVEKCAEETLAGDPDNPGHITVKPIELNKGLAHQYSVSSKNIDYLLLANPAFQNIWLDDGEKQLFAWLFAHKKSLPNDILIATADKAAIRAAHAIDFLDHVTSLEELAHQSKVRELILKKLKNQYRKDWLSQIKTDILLGS